MRGKILRDTNAGEGIVFVAGEQKRFTLEQHWKASTPPKVGGVVEVELGATGEVASVIPVDESELAKEQAQKALSALGGLSKTGANQLLARVSPVTLGAIALLATAWLFLSTYTVIVGRGMTETATFYEILKLLNNKGEIGGVWSVRSSGAGMYGLLFWIVLALPLGVHFVKVKFAAVGYFAPLILMLVATTGMYSGIKASVAEAARVGGMVNGLFGGRNAGAAAAEQMSREMTSQILSAINLDAGFYLATVAVAYLTFVGIKKLLVELAVSKSH
ncbi:MAG: hypothetical protein RLZZ271_255 [Pseudomonadota bacterium]|jgi:hypothetical protein